MKGGEVVRLLRGDMNRATVYGADPAAAARAFERDGAALIHIVDLDGAIAGEPRNLAAIAAIRAAVRCRIDVSGGLRTIGSVRAAIAAGADFISIGSAAFLDPELIRQACEEFPGRIFGSLDLRGGKLAIRGWVETSELGVAEAAERFRTAGVAAIIATDITRDGAETGADLELFASVAQTAGVPIIASGGVATLADLRALRNLYAQGVVGAISGRAIYEGRFRLADAIAVTANRQ
ncbi:1-(5-phosphoribosyl)-5-((5-phosphoribosylamino)methylideneamino)imidazole-4-carboxamide isomerase [bacterium]|nr:1-(5-phosphoribosyl)-5-((5-phosphoribosylamino)methylideneamino)imidazole-4-carboxamide isomerase [bacterium]